MRSSAPCRVAAVLALSLAVVALAACSDDGNNQNGLSGDDVATDETGPADTTAPEATTTTLAQPENVYEFTGANELADSVRNDPSLVYVPNNDSATVQVIDPATFEIVNEFPVGRLPQHVVPSHDMRTLYVNNNQGNTLTPIDPVTGQPGADIPVNDPYNLYFTPDGTKAVVMAERESQIDFRDPQTWELIASVEIPYSGVNHADFSADGTYMLASCEFSGWVVKIDLTTLQLSGELETGGQPIDVRIAPDGKNFFVANQSRNGISVIDPVAMAETAFVSTGAGTHGIYPSRDATQLFVSNRAAGTVSVIDIATLTVVATWTTGGSPDMGGVTADGSQLWLSSRYNAAVYVLDTATGEVIRTINTDLGPHGLLVWPQPGRYSLGHTGNMR
jgi:YVTN family beta-propeller protein